VPAVGGIGKLLPVNIREVPSAAATRAHSMVSRWTQFSTSFESGEGARQREDRRRRSWQSSVPYAPISIGSSDEVIANMSVR
jgi:hypothetical protein